ncbi:HK97 family phage prohead protease [Phycicoccus sp. KQZ13P-1]|uniref:HK97 family phage prohead protease n=1 Tax=Phycicoccus mangrovi TaxID=2840470 RepID=UPI001C003D7D|nr:HK97 family phage prohead protease [Phycicoccus mangrovi]MBT9255381.1 HK97 family phage prohead protease [Phycicoccus mangrovi]
MNLEMMARAAEARAAGVEQRSHRPRQRRSSEHALEGVAPRVAFRSEIELRAADAGSDLLHFTGYASVYERGYEMWDFFGPYTEVVSAGAAADTLSRDGLDVPLVLQHDSLRRIARTTNGTLTLSEDETGLLVDAPALDQADADVAYIAPKLRSGLIDEMSFMFRITSGVWSPDYTEYRISSFDIHRGDVAIVGYGANPATAGSGLRAAAPPAETRSDVSRSRMILDLALARH